MKEKIKLVIFDLDRTIVFLPIDWIKVKENIRKNLEINDPLTPLFPNIKKLTINNIELRKKIFKIIEKEEIKIIDKIVFNSKIYEIFKELKIRNFKIALITFQSRKVALKILNKMNILNFFDNILTREESLDREEQIRIALNKLNFKPFETIVIADKDEDISSAKKIGCKTIAVKNEKVNSDYKIDNIIELLNVINILE